MGIVFQNKYKLIRNEPTISPEIKLAILNCINAGGSLSTIQRVVVKHIDSISFTDLSDEMLQWISKYRALLNAYVRPLIYKPIIISSDALPPVYSKVIIKTEVLRTISPAYWPSAQRYHNYIESSAQKGSIATPSNIEDNNKRIIHTSMLKPIYDLYILTSPVSAAKYFNRFHLRLCLPVILCTSETELISSFFHRHTRENIVQSLYRDSVLQGDTDSVLLTPTFFKMKPFYADAYCNANANKPTIFTTPRSDLLSRCIIQDEYHGFEDPCISPKIKCDECKWKVCEDNCNQCTRDYTHAYICSRTIKCTECSARLDTFPRYYNACSCRTTQPKWSGIKGKQFNVQMIMGVLSQYPVNEIKPDYSTPDSNNPSLDLDLD